MCIGCAEKGDAKVNSRSLNPICVNQSRWGVADYPQSFFVVLVRVCAYIETRPQEAETRQSNSSIKAVGRAVPSPEGKGRLKSA